jgi:isopentenyldiphosphate isomerase
MFATDEPDELLDLVDEADRVIGTIRRGDIMAQYQRGEPGFVRAANAFIVNSKGQLWVPTRSPHKHTAPNGLDYSAGEHVASGETYLQAAIRGFREEAGMEVREQDLEYVGKILLTSVGLPYFSAVYLYRGDHVPDYSKEDFVSYEWLTPEELLKKLQTGVPAKKDMVPTLELLQIHQSGDKS